MPQGRRLTFRQAQYGRAPGTRSLRWAARSSGLALCLLLCSGAYAQDTAPAQLSTEIGFGAEHQTSALVRLSPQGELISIDGQRQLASSHLRLGVQGFANWQLGDALSMTFAGDASQKRTPATSEFDFASASLQPSLHLATPMGSLGWGLTLQRIDVAGSTLRDVRGTQLDWTVVEADGSLWATLVEFSGNRHPEAYADLDGSTTSVMLQRRLVQPGAGLEALDFTAYLARQRNHRGFDELSYRSAMLSATLQWRWGHWDWSAGTSLQTVQFDASAFAQDAARVDRAISLDLALEHELTPRQALRLEHSAARSVSTQALYDNVYQQVAIKLRTTW